MTDDEEPLLDEKGPERTCIVTRTKGDPRRMLRFVLGPENLVVADLQGRLPGRGAWVTAEVAVVEAAVKRRAFSRTFKREVTAEAGLAGRVGALMESAALGALSLANKAGLVVAGAFKVEDALRGGRARALLHATDAGPDGVRKIDAAARRAASPERPPVESLQIFDSRQMDLALGRANVIHAALLVGGATEAALERIARWQRYCGAGLPPQTGREAVPATIPVQAGAEAIRK